MSKKKNKKNKQKHGANENDIWGRNCKVLECKEWWTKIKNLKSKQRYVVNLKKIEWIEIFYIRLS